MSGRSRREASANTSRRAKKRQRLTVDKSDRAVRLLRVQTLAQGHIWRQGESQSLASATVDRTFGRDAALGRSDRRGARVIETVLGKIAWGAAA